MGYQKRVCLLTAAIALFLTMGSADGANSTNTAKSTAATFETVNNANTQKAAGENTEEKLRFHHQEDWKNGRVKIYWASLQNASRYEVVCTRKKGSKTILEKDISAQEETAFVHEMEYGQKYEYRVCAYQNDNGNESVLSYAYYELNISLSSVGLDNYVEKKTKKNTTLVFYPIDDNYISPTGIEIYHGKDKKHMKLIRTVKYEELSDFDPESEEYRYAKKYVDKNRAHIDYYQLRSYIDINGMKKYGKKSKIQKIRENGYRGEVKARIKVNSKKQYIKKMEVIIKNTGKVPIKVGMPYIKNYYKKRQFKKKYALLLYDDELYPFYSSNDLKIDKIEYRSQASKKYKTLSKDATVAIKPGEKISLRFSRKNGQKFRNYLVYGDDIPGDRSRIMSLYLFQHMGKKAFICISVQYRERKAGLYTHFYAHMEKDENGEPYTYDLQD